MPIEHSPARRDTTGNQTRSHRYGYGNNHKVAARK